MGHSKHRLARLSALALAGALTTRAPAAAAEGKETDSSSVKRAREQSSERRASGPGAREKPATPAQRQWQRFVRGRLREGTVVRWRVTVTSTFSYGGYNVWCHLEGDPRARVRAFGTVAYDNARRFEAGRTLEVVGRLQRVPEEGWVGLFVDAVGPSPADEAPSSPR